MKKKTHEEYVKELKEKNPNVEVMEKYVNSQTKLIHHCLKHDICWDALPSSVLMGAGCNMCKKEKFRKSRTKSHNQYVREVYSVNPEIVVLGQYIDAKTPVLHRCTKHNIEWYCYPDNILKGHGCYKCGYDKTGEKNSKTDDEYKNELSLKSKSIISLEPYLGANVPVLHKCLTCGHIWKVRPAGVIYGRGCPKCANNIKRTQEQYIEEVFSINPHIKVLEKYVNANTPILHKCTAHNIEWNATPSWILHGGGCYECGKEKISRSLIKPQSVYQDELRSINPNIVLLGEYKGSNTPTLHKCLICGYEWNALPSHIIFSGKGRTGCPQCNESKGERDVRQFLSSKNIKYISQKTFPDCKAKSYLLFDFYLPDYNAAIEYDGEQHFMPIDFFGGEDGYQKRIEYDNIKNTYCKNNGISLLRIPYYKNIEEELNNFLFI